MNENLVVNTIILFADHQTRLQRMAGAKGKIQGAGRAGVVDGLIRDIIDAWPGTITAKRPETEPKKKRLSSLRADQWDHLTRTAIQVSGVQGVPVSRNELIREIIEAALRKGGF